MNFLALQNAVLSNTFDSSLLSDVKNWINAKYTEICDLEDWTFMRAAAGVTVTSGSQTVTNLPSDFGIANALLDQYGNALELIHNPAEFVRRYMDTTTTWQGQPEAFTVFGSPATFDGGLMGDGDFGGGEGLIAVGPYSNVTSNNFRLLYERAVPTLSADADVPVLPTGYHMVLVAGARALGCRLYGMFAEAEQNDAEFRAGVDVLRAKYKRPLRDRSPQSPAYRPL